MMELEGHTKCLFCTPHDAKSEGWGNFRGQFHHTSSSSGALDSLAAVLKTLGVNDTEIEPDDLGSGTGFSNISFFLPMK